MKIRNQAIGILAAILFTSCGQATPSGGGSGSGTGGSPGNSGGGGNGGGDLTDGAQPRIPKTKAECEKIWTLFVASNPVGQILTYEIVVQAKLVYSTRTITESSETQVTQSTAVSGVGPRVESTDKTSAIISCMEGSQIVVGVQDKGLILKTSKESKKVRGGEFSTIYTSTETKLPSEALKSSILNEVWTSDDLRQIVVYRRTTVTKEGATLVSTSELLKITGK